MRQSLQKLSTDSTNWLYLLLLFPIIDYILRKLPIPVIPSLWDKLVLVVLLCFSFFAFLEGTRKMPQIKHVLSAFFVLGIGLIVSDMANIDASFEGFRAVYQYLLAFFIGFYLIQSPDQLERFIKLLALVGFVVALIGVMQVALGVQTPESWINEGESTRTRAFSIVTSPNVLGSFMAFISPIALGLLLKARANKERLLWAVVALTAIAALVFTMSRGAWFAFAFVVLVGCYIWNRRIGFYLLIAAIVVVGSSAIALSVVPHIPVLSTIKDRLVTLFSEDYLIKSLSDGRLARWANSFHELRFEPLFGKGLGHYGGAVASRRFGTIYSDSYLFKTIAEMGIIGTGLLLGLMFMVLNYARSLLKKWQNTPYFFLGVGVFCGMLALALHNMVENIFEVPFMNTYFWLVGGFLTGLLVQSESSTKQQTHV